MTRHVVEFPQVSPNMLISTPRIIAVTNQKGGVGKTTTVMNLGAALAERGAQVLVIDLDPQSNSTSGLGIDPSRARLTVYHLLSGDASIDEVAGAEIELVSESDREARLRRALSALTGGFGYVLIDCPPSLGLLTLNALAAADQALVPLQAEYFALEGLAHLLYTLQLVRMNLNPKLDLAGIVITQFDARTTLSWDVLNEVRRAYPDKLYQTLIPRNVRVSEASSHGQPVTIYDPTCRGSQAFRQLAEEVMNQ